MEELSEEMPIEEDPSEEELTDEEPFEEEASEELSEENPSEELLDEEHNEGQIEEPFEEFVSKSSFYNGSNNKHLTYLNQYNSCEEKRSAVTTGGQSRKKHKREQPLWPEHDSGPSGNFFEENIKTSKSSSNISSSKGQGNFESSEKKRHSRWDKKPEGDGKALGAGLVTNRRKTRWAGDDAQLKLPGRLQLPAFTKDLVDGVDLDPKIRDLNEQLLEIKGKLQASEVVDDRPEKERSPSPLPIYNDLGIRINTREFRLRQKLVKQRQEIILELVSRSPLDYKPQKLFKKKLHFPVNQYPGLNLSDLSTEPCRNAQKRVELESGVIISIGMGQPRMGKTARERARENPDRYRSKELYIIFKGPNSKSVEAAVKMLEELFLSVGVDIRRRSQLREHAELNGTPIGKTASKIDAQCNICFDAGHDTNSCPLIAPTNRSKLDNQDTLGGLSPFNGPPVHNNASIRLCPLPTPSQITKSNKGIFDDANLFVGCLPLTVNDDRLVELFSPFGTISQSKLVKVKATGLSSGYGFVRYTDPICAAKAVQQMNGHKIDGKILIVRVAGPPLVDAPPSISGNAAHPTSSCSSTASTLGSKTGKEIDDANLYVSYLPLSVNDDRLVELFSPFGAIVQSIVVRDKATCLSKGYGFVRYTDPICAAKAVKQMNGHKIDGKILIVRVADPPLVDAPPSISGNAAHPTSSCSSIASTLGSKTGKEIDDANLYVSYLPLSVNDDRLVELFSPFGAIVQSIVVRDKATCLSKGYGFVRYADPICAAKAVKQMNGHKIDGKILIVRVADPPLVDAPLSISGNAAHPTSSCSSIASTLGSKTGKEIDDANLYVSYLPLSVNDDRLVELFSPFGAIVQSIVVRDKATCLSKGYGFVRYADPICAAKAVKQMNGHKIDGKILIVRVADPPLVDAPPSISGNAAHPTSSCSSIASTLGSKTGKEIDDANLYVSYLPLSVNDDRLVELFSPFGAIVQSIVVRDKPTCLSKGYGFVRYADPICAAKAVKQMNGHKIDGKYLSVRIAGRPPIDAAHTTFASSSTTPTPGSMTNKHIDDGNLYVSDLPFSVGDDRLLELFSPFGTITKLELVKDEAAGTSKGYGFVTYKDPISAAKAVEQMNRKWIDGKMLRVQVAGLPLLTSSSVSLVPSYPGHAAALTQQQPGQNFWPRLPDNNSSTLHNHLFTTQPASYGPPNAIPVHAAPSMNFAQYPGNPRNVGSQYFPYRCDTLSSLCTTPVSSVVSTNVAQPWALVHSPCNLINISPQYFPHKSDMPSSLYCSPVFPSLISSDVSQSTETNPRQSEQRWLR